MGRFIVVDVQTACQNRYPGWEDFKRDLACGDFFWCLYETDREKPIRLVATDEGEPEDQTSARYWNWVAQELNKIEQENST